MLPANRDAVRHMYLLPLLEKPARRGEACVLDVCGIAELALLPKRLWQVMVRAKAREFARASG